MTRIQIIDDDYWCGEAIVATLTSVARPSQCQITTKPEPTDGFDVYIVDNEFEDGDHGVDIVATIRRRNPDATIVICTATKERIDATSAMNAGCNAMVEKGSAAGRAMLSDVVAAHIRRRAQSAQGATVGNVFSDIKSIITAWNARVEQDEARQAADRRVG